VVVETQSRLRFVDSCKELVGSTLRLACILEPWKWLLCFLIDELASVVELTHHLTTSPDLSRVLYWIDFRREFVERSVGVAKTRGGYFGAPWARQAMLGCVAPGFSHSLSMASIDG
jgi:hypothetical protein